MRSMEEQFNEKQCIHTLRIFSGDHRLEEMPHCDTLNYYLEKLSPSCLSDLRRRMVKSLIRNKSFYKGRLLGKYWRVIIDGTGLFYFKEKHCGNCLVTAIEREDGKRRSVITIKYWKRSWCSQKRSSSAWEQNSLKMNRKMSLKMTVS